MKAKQDMVTMDRITLEKIQFGIQQMVSTAMEHKQCEFSPSCSSETEFALYRTYENGDKCWLQVCDKHERFVAGENLRRCGGLVKVMQKTGDVRDKSGLIVRFAHNGDNRERHQTSGEGLLGRKGYL